MNDTREQLLGKVCHEDDRVQYDGKDELRIAMGTQLLTQGSVMAIHAMGAYRDAMSLPVDENSADKMKEARYDAILGLATLQIALSKLAWVLRIEFEEAYKRVLETGPSETHPELNDL